MSNTSTIELVEIPQIPNTTPVAARQDVEVSVPPVRVESKGTTAVIIATITGVTLISALLAGIVTIALPVIAKDLKMSEELMLW